MKAKDALAHKVVAQMMHHDYFSKWLGISVVATSKGYCELKLKVRQEMLNGFGIAHGGITYSLADSALAFASNSHGIKSVSIETSISHVAQVHEGDVLTAVASEVSRTSKIAIYNIVVSNGEGKTVALFKGIVYRTGKDWFPHHEKG